MVVAGAAPASDHVWPGPSTFVRTLEASELRQHKPLSAHAPAWMPASPYASTATVATYTLPPDLTWAQ
jgi:hypothetical protein